MYYCVNLARAHHISLIFVSSSISVTIVHPLFPGDEIRPAEPNRKGPT